MLPDRQVLLRRLSLLQSDSTKVASDPAQSWCQDLWVHGLGFRMWGLGFKALVCSNICIPSNLGCHADLRNANGSHALCNSHRLSAVLWVSGLPVGRKFTIAPQYVGLMGPKRFDKPCKVPKKAL